MFEPSAAQTLTIAEDGAPAQYRGSGQDTYNVDYYHSKTGKTFGFNLLSPGLLICRLAQASWDYH